MSKYSMILFCNIVKGKPGNKNLIWFFELKNEKKQTLILCRLTCVFSWKLNHALKSFKWLSLCCVTFRWRYFYRKEIHLSYFRSILKPEKEIAFLTFFCRWVKIISCNLPDADFLLSAFSFNFSLNASFWQIKYNCLLKVWFLFNWNVLFEISYEIVWLQAQSLQGAAAKMRMFLNPV